MGGGSLNKLLIFSPFITHQSNINLTGYDEAASNFLSFSGNGWIDNGEKQGGVLELNLPIKPANSLKFFFQLH